MAETPQSSPNSPLPHLAGALITSSVYAVWLNSKTGRRWADEQTWATVVAGVAMTLGWLASWRPRAAGWAFVFFAVTGVPIILRSLDLQIKQIEAAINRAMR